ncbi:MAG: rhomboid family intramembrane serine protease [Bacteroidetes bacterium]|nr:MAG: rhomboid family intramembrane serine protease [Bacteroidota bacterium]
MINYFLIAVTAVISILAFQNPELMEKLKFNAYKIKYSKQTWRFFTYGLVHAGWMHLIVNMFVLWSFGEIVENFLVQQFGYKGDIYYLLLYVAGIIFSTLVDFRRNKENIYYNAVGASGAVSAVVFASILIHPGGSIFVFPIPIPIPSWLFGILYLAYSAYMAKRGTDNVGHTAHFWGAVVGVIFMVLMTPSVFHSFIGYFIG